MKRTPEETDEAVAAYAALSEQIAELSRQRSKLADTFARGRTEGNFLAVYRSPDGRGYRYDAKRLQQLVPAETLLRCRMSSPRKGSLRLVSKLKPRKLKELTP